MTARSTIFSLVALGFASPALAADVIQEPIVVDQAFNWSGIYAGIDMGYAEAEVDLNTADLINVPFDESLQPEGLLGGIHIGVNHQLANGFVVGGEADVMFSDVDGTELIPVGSGGAGFGMEFNSRLEWSASARLRAGYALDRTLPFITAGVAAARYELTGNPIGMPSLEFEFHEETHVGWTVGAGVEHAFTDALAVRAEYRFSDFGTEDLSFLGFGTPGEIDLKTHDVRIGLSYLF